MQGTAVSLLAVALAMAAPLARASCITNAGTGESSCSGRVTDLQMFNNEAYVRVRLNDMTGNITCTLDGSFWRLPTTDTNFSSYYQLLIVSSATAQVVEITTGLGAPTTGPCIAQSVRLVSP